MVCHPLYGHTSLPPLSRAQYSHKLHLFSLQTTAQLSKCNPRPLHPDPHSAATTPAAVPSHFRLMGRQGKSYTRSYTFHTENLLPFFYDSHSSLSKLHLGLFPFEQRSDIQVMTTQAATGRYKRCAFIYFCALLS